MLDMRSFWLWSAVAAVVLAALLLLSTVAHAADFECPAGRKCLVRVTQGPSPEVDEVCLMELARPGRPAPAPGVFLACASTKLGAPNTTLVDGKVLVGIHFGPVATDAAHVLFTPVSCDIDRVPKLCSTNVADRVFAPSSISAPRLLELALDALSSAADSIRDAMESMAGEAPWPAGDSAGRETPSWPDKR